MPQPGRLIDDNVDSEKKHLFVLAKFYLFVIKVDIAGFAVHVRF